MGILAESQRKARAAADLTLKEIEEEKFLEKMKLIGELLENKFDKIQRLAHVLEQNDWLADPEKGLQRFQERCEKLLSNSKAWSSKVFGEDDFKGPPWLQRLNEKFDGMLKLVRMVSFGQRQRRAIARRNTQVSIIPFFIRGDYPQG